VGIIEMGVTAVGSESGRLIASNVKAQGGGRITLICNERGEVDGTGTGLCVLTVLMERDAVRSNTVNRLPVLRPLRCTNNGVSCRCRLGLRSRGYYPVAPRSIAAGHLCSAI
jgi:hypothetical protein